MYNCRKKFNIDRVNCTEDMNVEPFSMFALFVSGWNWNRNRESWAQHQSHESIPCDRRFFNCFVIYLITVNTTVYRNGTFLLPNNSEYDKNEQINANGFYLVMVTCYSWVMWKCIYSDILLLFFWKENITSHSPFFYSERNWYNLVDVSDLK